VALAPAPWSEVDEALEDDAALEAQLLDLFRIGTDGPQLNKSLKPFVLLFDEFYTDLYRMSEAEARMRAADRMVFMGTSFSVNITRIALGHAMVRRLPIEVVDPAPVSVNYSGAVYHQMSASEYIAKVGDEG
jgi:NAD-dependent deacetylase